MQPSGPCVLSAVCLVITLVLPAVWVSGVRVTSMAQFLAAVRRHYALKDAKHNNNNNTLSSRAGAYGAQDSDYEPITGVGWGGFYGYPAQVRGYGVEGSFPIMQPGYGMLAFENYALGYYSPYYTGYLNQGYGSSSGYRPATSGYSDVYSQLGYRAAQAGTSAGGGGSLSYRSAYSPQRYSAYQQPIPVSAYGGRPPTHSLNGRLSLPVSYARTAAYAEPSETSTSESFSGSFQPNLGASGLYPSGYGSRSIVNDYNYYSPRYSTSQPLIYRRTPQTPSIAALKAPNDRYPAYLNQWYGAAQ